MININAIIHPKPLHSARVHHLLKRIGSEHHKLKSAIKQHQMAKNASTAILCIPSVITLPLEVISFRKITIIGMAGAIMSAFGIQKI